MRGVRTLHSEVHEQVAGLLRSPFPARVQGDAEDADAPGRVLDNGQHVSLGAVEQVDREEVACQDRLGLRTQELRPGRPGPSWLGRIDAAGLGDLPYGRRGDLDSQPGQLAVDPAVPPFGVLACEPEDQGLDIPADWTPVLPRMDLVAQRRRTISRCQRRIVSGVTSSRNPWRRGFGITPSRARSA